VVPEGRPIPDPHEVDEQGEEDQVPQPGFLGLC
jgi:hypothetical protein